MSQATRSKKPAAKPKPPTEAEQIGELVASLPTHAKEWLFQPSIARSGPSYIVNFDFDDDQKHPIESGPWVSPSYAISLLASAARGDCTVAFSEEFEPDPEGLQIRQDAFSGWLLPVVAGNEINSMERAAVLCRMIREIWVDFVGQQSGLDEAAGERFDAIYHSDCKGDEAYYVKLESRMWSKEKS